MSIEARGENVPSISMEDLNAVEATLDACVDNDARKVAVTAWIAKIGNPTIIRKSREDINQAAEFIRLRIDGETRFLRVDIGDFGTIVEDGSATELWGLQ